MLRGLRIIVPVLVVAILVPAIAFGQGSAGVVNVGFDIGALVTAGRLTAFVVNEARQNNTDLNGDGDSGDDVLHLYDAVTREVTNVGLDTFFLFAFDGERVVFGVTEANEGVGGTDLNGDGDTDDMRVLHVYDVATGAVSNLGFEVSASVPVVDGPLVAFSVPESLHGHGSLNGDSDDDDFVMHVFDARTGATTNLGLAASGFRVGGELVVFRVPEDEQGDTGTDLNGDGAVSFNDNVLHVHDVRTGVTTNLALVAFDFAIDGDIVAFNVVEFAQGSGSLNADMDSSDVVVHYYDASAGLPAVNVGIAGSAIQAAENRIIFIVFEFAEDRDLNLDGDKGFLDGDRVLHVYDVATASTRNVGFDADRFTLTGDLVSFNVSEARQNASDLNGDSDATDLVAHAVRLGGPMPSPPVNIGLHSLGTINDGENVALVAHESEQGADLNGDGDLLDRVPHLWNAARGVTNTQLASFGAALDRGTLAFSVLELFQNNTDLNGDGDASDGVFHVFDGLTGRVKNLELAGVALRLEKGRLALAVREDWQNGTDLNDDADTGDSVLHVGGTVAVLIELLIEAVEELDLPQGLDTALTTKLETALDKLVDSDPENDSAALGAIGAFIHLVEAQEGKKVDPTDAAELIEAATAILTALDG